MPGGNAHEHGGRNRSRLASGTDMLVVATRVCLTRTPTGSGADKVAIDSSANESNKDVVDIPVEVGDRKRSTKL